MDFQTKKKLLTLLPENIVNIIKKYYYRCTYAKYESNSVVLQSIPKSGTNYFGLFMVNYLSKLSGNKENLVNKHYRELLKHEPTREQYLVYDKKFDIKKKEVLKPYWFDYFHMTHTTAFFEFFEGRMVHLYRNPLDNLISRYFFTIKYRKGRENSMNHPREYIEEWVVDYARLYSTMKEFSRKNSNILRISYESLMVDPVNVFAICVKHCKLEVNYDALISSIKASSFKSVRKDEEQNGNIKYVEDYTGFFARSGKVGDWKNYLDEDDIKKVKELLLKYDISLDEFIIDLDDDKYKIELF